MNPQEEQNLIKRIEALEAKLGKLNYPLDFNSQGAIEAVLFKTLKTLQLKGALPIYTVARADTPMPGEFWIENIAGTQRVVAYYVNGAKYVSSIN